MNCLGQQSIKSLPLQPDSQRHLLSLFCAPSGPKHHPEKIRFEPAHPRQRELTAKVAMLSREMPDSGTIGLVDDDRVLIILRQDVAALTRPAGVLCEVWFGDKVHLYFLLSIL